MPLQSGVFMPFLGQTGTSSTSLERMSSGQGMGLVVNLGHMVKVQMRVLLGS